LYSNWRVFIVEVGTDPPANLSLCARLTATDVNNLTFYDVLVLPEVLSERRAWSLQILLGSPVEKVLRSVRIEYSGGEVSGYRSSRTVRVLQIDRLHSWVFAPEL